jgi:two-component system, sporulation sensor kinase D
MPYGGRLIINAIPDYQANEIAVSFLDTGCGISPEDLNKMFTPFFTTKENGVGLGLCLSHEVIACHKGSIRIESKVGEGTEVIVRFPFSRGDQEKQKF